MRIWKASILFYIGGSAYMILEFLWRGRSHGSMFLLGGLCFLLVGHLSKRLGKLPLAVQLIIFAAAITGAELLTGLLVNRDYAVWDYRQMPFQYLGQICLNYSLLWIPVSFAARTIYANAEKILPK